MAEYLAELEGKVGYPIFHMECFQLLSSWLSEVSTALYVSPGSSGVLRRVNPNAP